MFYSAPNKTVVSSIKGDAGSNPPGEHVPFINFVRVCGPVLVISVVLKIINGRQFQIRVIAKQITFEVIKLSD